MLKQTVLLICVAVSPVVVTDQLLGQVESTRPSARVVSLRDVLRPQWAFSDFQIASIVSNGGQLYLLLRPAEEQKRLPALLVTLTQGGTKQRIQQLPHRVDPRIGIDGEGTVTVIETTKGNRGLLKYSADGVPLTIGALDQSRGGLASARLALRKSRPTSTDGIRDSHTIENISDIVPSSSNPYVDALRSDGKTVRLYLANPWLTVLGGSGESYALDRDVIGRFGTHIERSGNVSYPDLYSIALSPRGTLWGLVSGIRLASGAVAINPDPATGKINAILHLPLPTRDEEKAPGNADGYLVPAILAICENSVVLANGDTGLLAFYDAEI